MSVYSQKAMAADGKAVVKYKGADIGTIIRETDEFTIVSKDGVLKSTLKTSGQAVKALVDYHRG